MPDLLERFTASPLSRQALLGLGCAAIVGLGCATITRPPPKDERAVSQFAPAADQGSAVAQYQLATSYRYGTSGLPKDGQAALRWFRAAADAGQADAAFALGDIYLRGELGVAPDSAQALEWFRKAAQNHLGNALWLAGQLEQGRPGLLAQDKVGARELYLAVWPRSPLACQRLGTLAERGGADRGSRVEALTWYIRANARGDGERLEKTMTRDEIEQARAEAARGAP